MASGSINSWQIEKVEAVTDFIFLGSKITEDGDCSHEIKRRLLWRKAMKNIDSILKSRDIILLTKVHIVKAMVFPVVMYGRESWTIKKAEHQRTEAFELCSWRRLFRVPWTARRSDQSVLKETNPKYSLEGLMLKLRLQYFSHLMQRADSLENTLMLEKTEGNRWGVAEDERFGWHHQLNGHEFEQTPGDGEAKGSLMSTGSKRVRHDLATEKQQYIYSEWVFSHLHDEKLK